MKLTILYALVDGEPEAHEVADEYTMQENPGWLDLKEQELQSQGVRTARLVVKIPDVNPFEPKEVDGEVG